MASPELFRFAKIPIGEAEQAFRFHERVCADDPHLWPRSRDDLRQYANDGSLFGVRLATTGELVGLVYSIPGKSHSENPDYWEIGGLAVDLTFRSRGVGTVLVRFAMVQTMLLRDPWRYGQRVVAHVHERNNDPRRLLENLGFVWTDEIEAPPSAPQSMKRNERGKVVGDEFDLSLDGLRGLSAWFDAFDGTLGRAGTHAEFDFGTLSFNYTKKMLREMAADASAQPPLVKRGRKAT